MGSFGCRVRALSSLSRCLCVSNGELKLFEWAAVCVGRDVKAVLVGGCVCRTGC